MEKITKTSVKLFEKTAAANLAKGKGNKDIFDLLFDH